MELLNIAREEFHKVFIKNHFLWIFLAVLLFDITQTKMQPQPTMFNNQLSQDIYDNEIKNLLGPYEETKVNTMREKADKAFSFLANLEQEYNNPNKYLEKFKHYPDIYESVPAYKLLVSQANYVQTEPNERYFLNPGGWEHMFSDVPFEYKIILLVVGMSAFIYSNEYETKVNQLNQSTYLGKSKRFIVQTGIMFGGVLILLLLVYLERYIIFSSTLKEVRHYPFVSLPHFKESVFKETIQQALYLLISIRLVGFFYIITFIAFISQLFKTSVVSYYLGIVLAIAPLLLFDTHKLYQYPLPSTWILGSGFLKMPINQLVIIVISTFLIILAMWSVILIRIRKEG